MQIQFGDKELTLVSIAEDLNSGVCVITVKKGDYSTDDIEKAVTENLASFTQINDDKTIVRFEGYSVIQSIASRFGSRQVVIRIARSKDAQIAELVKQLKTQKSNFEEAISALKEATSKDIDTANEAIIDVYGQTETNKDGLDTVNKTLESTNKALDDVNEAIIDLYNQVMDLTGDNATDAEDATEVTE